MLLSYPEKLALPRYSAGVVEWTWLLELGEGMNPGSLVRYLLALLVDFYIFLRYNSYACMMGISIPALQCYSED